MYSIPRSGYIKIHIVEIYTSSLQLPSNFVDVDREEMEYVDGGGLFISNRVIQGAIDVAIWIVPGLKFARTGILAVTMMSSVAKTALARAICTAVSKVTFSWFVLSQNSVLNAIMTFTGASIGGFIAEKLIDPLDGSRNGGVWIG